MTDLRQYTQRCEHCPRASTLYYSRAHDAYLCEECIQLPAELPAELPDVDPEDAA